MKFTVALKLKPKRYVIMRGTGKKAIPHTFLSRAHRSGFTDKGNATLVASWLTKSSLRKVG